MPGAVTSASGSEQIEVITSVQRRRGGSLDEKIRAVEESSVPGMALTSPSQLFHWRKLMAEGGKVAVLLNRELRREGNAPVDRKRIHRLMAQNGLLLARHTGRGRQVSHDGTLIALQSNLHWCSDIFEFPCWDGEKVRIAFMLGAGDRKTIRYVGARFGATVTSHPVEWLTDNGSCYTSNDTIEQAYALGIIPCFTPVRSPESNGHGRGVCENFQA